MDEFRRTVRACRHGVLVSTGCLRGALRCDAFGPYRSGARGLFAVAQPCDAHRRPVGGAIALGPVAGRADASAVCRWLLAGLPDDGSLPARLLAAPPPWKLAHLN
ncbi:hypothetical protein NGB36_01950 [Streptomyces sp. RB6PN25]|uniref:Uncharacterized protein n=1 Tax=Streptomyces humicola TaxID=2953240 RepID=A0ABT1PNZ2_9ACTN|nr:hypothetical protein [Streptomyces humicola]MCQ4079397.1 hypothetical protein [Streptomyces humicola]